MKSFIIAHTIALCALVIGLTQPTSSQSASSEEINLKNPLPNNCGAFIGGPEWIEVNENDDNKDEDWDKNVEPVVDEKDTKVIAIRGTADKSEATVVVTIIAGLDKVDGFWPGTLTIDGVAVGDEVKGAQKDSGRTMPFTFKVPAGKTAVQTLWIEGIKNSASLSDVVKIQATATAPAGTLPDGLAFKASNPPPQTHELLVYKVDIDVDSNNNEKLTFSYGSDDEDKIEASEKIQSTGGKRPGKYLFVNAGFNAGNNDACPGWADGFDINPGSSTDNVAAVFQFTPVLLELPEPFDPAKAEIEFDYDASDPATVTFAASATAGTPTDQFSYTLGTSGKLRLWKKDSPGTRNKDSVATGGDFVPKAKFPWSKLGPGRTVTLYLEGVRPSSALGDLGISVIATEGGGVTCKDKVNVTSVYFNNEIITISSSCSTYGFSGGRYTGIGGNAADYAVKADFVPASVEKSRFPMDDIKIGILQNAKDSENIIIFNNPTITWLATSNSGDVVAYPSEWYQLAGYHARINDSAGSVQPLYDRPGTGQTLDPNSLVVPGPSSGSATSADTPSTPAATYEREVTASGSAAGSPPVAKITYSVKKVTLTKEFVVWVTGYDEILKQIYPLAECDWNLKVDSNGAMPQMPQCFTQKANTMVPVRDPISNDLINNPAMGGAVPVSGTPTIIITKP